jgi:hypothetical protein
MNYAGNDYAMCHLIRAATVTGTRRFRLDVIQRQLGPVELLTPKLVLACRGYCDKFGRLVTSSGAAMDMIDQAELEVVVRLGKPTTKRHQPGRVTARMRIRDDRGRLHEASVSESYPECAAPRDAS